MLATTLPFELGVEDEGWNSRKKGEEIVGVDVSPFLDSIKGVELPYGSFTRESGLGAIEYVGAKASSVTGAVSNIYALHEFARDRGLTVRFACKSPYPQDENADTLITEKSRFKAIVEAAKRESVLHGTTSSWKHLLRQNSYAAVHMHLSFPDFPVRPDYVAEEMVFVNNVLNLIGPRVAKFLCSKFGLDNTGHLGIFSEWANPRRFSYYGLWDAGFECMTKKLSKLTRFIHCVSGNKENGEWEPDLATPMQWGESDVAELGIWRMSRLRTKQGTIEIRFMPSMPLECLEDAVQDVLDLVVYLLSIAPKKCIDIRNLEDFMTSLLWEKVAKFKIGDMQTVPSEYTSKMWRQDYFH